MEMSSLRKELFRSFMARNRKTMLFIDMAEDVLTKSRYFMQC